MSNVLIATAVGGSIFLVKTGSVLSINQQLAKIHFFTVNKQIMRKNHFTNGKMDF